MGGEEELCDYVPDVRGRSIGVTTEAFFFRCRCWVRFVVCMIIDKKGIRRGTEYNLWTVLCFLNVCRDVRNYAQEVLEPLTY